MEILLDTRELEAPEPLELVMKNLSKVDKNTYIKMIHRMEPKILYNHLLNNHFVYNVQKENEDFHIYIYHEDYNTQD